MKTPTLIFTVAAITAASAAYADDEMMGTMINGRMETRAERSVRVQDREMDREQALIDRQRRAWRAQRVASGATEGAEDAEEMPFEYDPEDDAAW